MRLPFAEKAFVDDRKLIDYCLNPDHPVGKHKARVFQAALGINALNRDVLKRALLEMVLANEASFSGANVEGNLYTIDFLLVYQARQAQVRTAWMIKFDETFPRLVTCYVNPP